MAKNNDTIFWIAGIALILLVVTQPNFNQQEDFSIKVHYYDEDGNEIDFQPYNYEEAMKQTKEFSFINLISYIDTFSVIQNSIQGTWSRFFINGASESSGWIGGYNGDSYHGKMEFNSYNLRSLPSNTNINKIIVNLPMYWIDTFYCNNYNPEFIPISITDPTGTIVYKNIKLYTYDNPGYIDSCQGCVSYSNTGIEVDITSANSISQANLIASSGVGTFTIGFKLDSGGINDDRAYTRNCWAYMRPSSYDASYNIDYSYCQPETCSSLGKQCGSWSNTCSGTVNCGSCSEGYNCNSEGQCVQDISYISLEILVTNTGDIQFNNVRISEANPIEFQNALDLNDIRVLNKGNSSVWYSDQIAVKPEWRGTTQTFEVSIKGTVPQTGQVITKFDGINIVL